MIYMNRGRFAINFLSKQTSSRFRVQGLPAFGGAEGDQGSEVTTVDTVYHIERDSEYTTYIL